MDLMSGPFRGDRTCRAWHRVTGKPNGEGKEMECRLGELCSKELIDIRDGTRYGFVGDLELDPQSGRIRALVVRGRLRLFGLLGREADRTFPWESVRRFGEDIILVESGPGENRKY